MKGLPKTRIKLGVQSRVKRYSLIHNLDPMNTMCLGAHLAPKIDGEFLEISEVKDLLQEILQTSSPKAKIRYILGRLNGTGDL